jgi:hypothetical protein
MSKWPKKEPQRQPWGREDFVMLGCSVLPWFFIVAFFVLMIALNP